MMFVMLLLKDIPDSKILLKFKTRYEGADADSVIQFLSILKIGAELSEALDNFLAKYGLLQGRWLVLILLMREDDLTSIPSDLAEKIGVSRATMCGLINGLLRDGLIIKIDDRADRRSYSIKLSELGQAKLDEIMPDYYAKVKKMMGIFPVEIRNNLLKQLFLIKEQSRILE
jgi:DNA-binding MarR family transcriptional regulator